MSHNAEPMFQVSEMVICQKVKVCRKFIVNRHDQKPKESVSAACSCILQSYAWNTNERTFACTHSHIQTHTHTDIWRETHTSVSDMCWTTLTVLSICLNNL